MGKVLKRANFRKTLHYLKKNGILQTFYAARERMESERSEEYVYRPIAAEELERQKQETQQETLKFSILVPLYETKEEYLREMIQSVLDQSYTHFELILADASKTDRVKQVVESISDPRIMYRRLQQNGGIADNTNRALMYASGDYAGLLDHDDLLTEDALYEMWKKICEAQQQGMELQMIYSDEDKCNGDHSRYYEVNRKPEFNLDLIMSNNYICHFLVIKRQLLQELQLRSVYDGAQDFDLVLRTVSTLMGREKRRKTADKLPIAHIAKVLYHWRCHEDSTAENPESKLYAYEAGRRAVENFLRLREWKGTVSPLKHLGFYRVDYEKDLFENRPDVALLGGRILDPKNKITGGIYNVSGEALYVGLHKYYSGYMHRAVLQQEAEAVDVRCMAASPEGERIVEELTGLPYLKDPKTGRFDWRGSLKEDVDYRKLSQELCRKVREKGYRIVWDPFLTEKME